MLLMGIFYRVFVGNVLAEMIRSIMEAFGGMFGFGGMMPPGDFLELQMGISFFMSHIQVQLIFMAIVLGALNLLLYATCVKLTCAIHKVEIPFTTTLNIAAGASLIPSAAMAAGILISFISATAALFVVSMASIALYVVLYSSMKQVVSFKTGPLWAFIGLLSAAFLIYFFVVGLLVQNMITNAMMGMMNMPF